MMVARTVRRRRRWYLAAAPTVFLAVPAPTAAQWSAEIVVESRAFWRAPLSDEQRRHDASIALRPEYYRSWDRGRQSLIVEPFARLDASDGRRTHVDLRELSWQRAWERWELRVGIRKVFWGVTESQHLVDIVNQTDLVENLDGEDKLGQPMVNVAWIHRWGTLDLFVLPGFRERTFPGRRGRLRFPLVIDGHEAVFEADAGRGHIDWAVRWSHVLGDFDVGLSHFVGTNREPRFVASSQAGPPTLTPHYDLIDQTGVDLQYTRGGWLWKLEGITRAWTGERYYAFTGGFEYTWPGIARSAADFGLIAEYSFDDRGAAATTPFQNDLALGARLAFNDVQGSQLLGVIAIDRDGGGSFVSVEGSRRLGDLWKIAIESRGFLGVADHDPLHGLRRDAYLGISLSRFF